MPRPILIFEPDSTRLQTVRTLVEAWGDGYAIRSWERPAEFRTEVLAYLPRAALIVLGEGSGLDAWLSNLDPVCPVFGGNSETLQAGGWPVLDQLVQPCEVNQGVERMRRSLRGLAMGDALGEMMSYSARLAPERLARADFPENWYHTDDTEMALAISSILRAHGRIDQNALAARFVRRFQLDPDRGYGKMTRLQLTELAEGLDWQTVSASAFGGQGSMGNGSAMRVAPLGAYFADDLERCVLEAQASSQVTHTHPEAIAGCIAVAVAAALACRSSRLQLTEVVEFVPASQVRDRIQQAGEFKGSHLEAARLLGNGALVTAQDTVPYCLWIAAQSVDYVEAIGQAIQADGDCDTCAAITGGILALSAPETVPQHWGRHLSLALRT